MQLSVSLAKDRVRLLQRRILLKLTVILLQCRGYLHFLCLDDLIACLDILFLRFNGVVQCSNILVALPQRFFRLDESIIECFLVEGLILKLIPQLFLLLLRLHDYLLQVLQHLMKRSNFS